MACSGELSLATKRYLNRFYNILDEMEEGMTASPLTDSISRDFIVQMIPHHRAAIEMSQNLLQYTTFIPLETIAQRIIEEQTKSIEDMKAALPACSRLMNDGCVYQYREQFEKIIAVMFREMQNSTVTNSINANFMREMIPHHEGAIRMSENALRFSICPELIPILQDIISSQERGVREMKCLLRCIG